jgi:hypothetical protein
MATFGRTDTGNNTSPISNDRYWASKFTLSEAADVTSMSANFDSTSSAGTNGKFVIYDDDGASNLPGTRLAVSSAFSIPAGASEQSASCTVTLAAGDYWLGLVCDSFTAVLRTQTATGTSIRKESLTYATPADPMGTPDDSDVGSEFCIFATYSLTGSPNNRQFIRHPI